MASDHTERLLRRIGELEHENMLLLDAKREVEDELQEAESYIAALEARLPVLAQVDALHEPVRKADKRARDPYMERMGDRV